MSCDLSEIDMEITQVKNSIAVAEATIQSLDGNKAQLAELEAIKANCIKNAAGSDQNSVLGRARAYEKANPGKKAIIASHRSGATGQGTANLGVFEGTAGSRALEGGRRTRRSKKMRSKKMRSKSRKMRR
jgi:hypothetical protein